jgi:hypothetical protein
VTGRLRSTIATFALLRIFNPKQFLRYSLGQFEIHW